MWEKMTLSLAFLIAAILCFLFACLLGYTLGKLDIYHKVSFIVMLTLGATEIILLKIAPIILLLISLIMKILKK